MAENSEQQPSLRIKSIQMLRPWSTTLRLPKPAFPTRTAIDDFAKYIQKATDELYAIQSKQNHGNRFVLHDGPPYANGDLHIGHALNKILKDITCRYQLLQGKQIHFRPGWDCHGLPIELKALEEQKKLGNSGDKDAYEPIQVRSLARDLATKTTHKQMADFRRWAVMADWQNHWRTLDPGYELRQLEVFKQMVESGQIHERLRPVYWSPSSKTALAEAELEYKADHKSTAAFIRFPLFNVPDKVSKLLPKSSPVSLLIWTTTPWTIPANKAIAVHSDLEYALVETQNHGILIIAESRIPDISKLYELGPVLAKLSGSDLVNTTYKHPLLSQDAPPQPVFHADFVTADSGSGLVHSAPGHGMDDYKLCMVHGIEPLAPVDDAGCFTNQLSISARERLVGQEVLYQGQRTVLKLLEEASVLVASHKYAHKYPYDWRSKQPIIIRSTRQWFADLTGVRDSALKALQVVNYVPKGGQERLSSFVRARSEWCISRQRAWGVPIPALYRKGEAVMTPETVSHIINVIKKRGIDAWWKDDPVDSAWVPESLQAEGQFRRGTDTMDVWFDSGTSWKELDQPSADLYLEGSDQHRGWFQSSLLTKIATDTATKIPSAPFQILVTHGFVLDEHGKKMSKSEGNVISPNQIMNGSLLPPKRVKKSTKIREVRAITHDEMGPDALRLWVASSDYTRDVMVGQTSLKLNSDSLAKFRITFRLLCSLLDTYELACPIEFTDLRTIDRMALIHLRNLIPTVDAAYSEYAYHRVVAALNTYINNDFSAFYIECIRDRCYADSLESSSRFHAQAVLWEIFRALTRLLSPITPLLTFEACEYLPGQLKPFHPVLDNMSKVAEKWSSVQGQWKDDSLEKDMPYLFELSNHVKRLQENARVLKQMGSSLQCNVVCNVARSPPDETGLPRSTPFGDMIEHRFQELEDLFVVSKVTTYNSSELPEDSEIHSAEWSHQSRCTAGGDNGTEVVDVWVHAPSKLKCARCWKYHVDPSIIETSPEIDDKLDLEREPQATVIAQTSPKKSERDALKLEEPLCGRCLSVLDEMAHDDPQIFEGRPRIARAAANTKSLTMW